MTRQDELFCERQIERIRACWNARPCNIRHSPKPVELARKRADVFGLADRIAFTTASVRGLLRGFRVEQTFIDHIFLYRIPDTVQYRYVMNWYFRVLPRPVFRALERHFGWHWCVTARPEVA